MYRDVIDSMIETHGSPCVISGEGVTEAESRAFIEPMRYKYGSFARDYALDGVYDERYYLYIGKAEHDLSAMPAGTVIKSCGTEYYLDSAEIYHFCGSPLYCRAVLRRTGGAAE